MRELYWISLILMVVGCINWGLIGLFNFDVIAALFGEMTFITRTLYTVIAAASVLLLMLPAPWKASHNAAASL